MLVLTQLIFSYTEMRLATEERGSYIDQLGEQMNNASVSASNYLTQARNNAVSKVNVNKIIS